MSNSKGKLSLKDKELASEMPINPAFDDSDAFAIDPVLKAELDGKGLAHRWINAKTYKDNYGYDRRRWVPYKRESKAPSGYESYGYADPEGFIRRGDLILAAQPQAFADNRKAKIIARTASQANQNKQAAAELAETLKNSGHRAKVYEGYDENE